MAAVWKSSALASRIGFFTRQLTTEVSANTISTPERDEVVEYPPIKPKYPPGQWKGFSPSEAWRWYEDEESINRLPTIQSRLYENIGSKNQYYYFDCKPFLATPDLQGFYSVITKSEPASDLTASLEGCELSESSWENLINDVEETIFLESQLLTRVEESPTLTKLENDVRKRKLLLGNIITRLVTCLTHNKSDLLDYEIDRDVNVQTHWIRKGPKGALTQVVPGCLRYGYKQNTLLQLRSHLPLSTSDLDVNAVAQPEEEVDYNSGDYNPHMRGLAKDVYSLPHQAGFRYGSPCCHVPLSVLSPDYVDFSSVRKMMGERSYKQAVDSAALVHAFSTSYALAHYQGYDMHHDLVSPILTQCLLTDGQEFTKLTHQLNTLCLFKGDIDNSRYNAYSVSEPVKLYETVDENGKVEGFNPDAVKLIVNCILANLSHDQVSNPHIQADEVPAASGDLLPYLPVYKQNMDLPELEEGSVQIPTFSVYYNPDSDKSDRDLTRDEKRRREKERQHEYHITKGPLFGGDDPHARGKVKLDLHIEKVRAAERKKRIIHRDQVIAYLKQNKQSTTS